MEKTYNNMSVEPRAYYILTLKFNILSSSGVERSAVNRFVVGSNPTWGDIFYVRSLRVIKFYFALLISVRIIKHR